MPRPPFGAAVSVHLHRNKPKGLRGGPGQSLVITPEDGLVFADGLAGCGAVASIRRAVVKIAGGKGTLQFRHPLGRQVILAQDTDAGGVRAVPALAFRLFSLRGAGQDGVLRVGHVGIAGATGK
nr:hypothetical protein [Falsirhodobacter deserti]